MSIVKSIGKLIIPKVLRDHIKYAYFYSKSIKALTKNAHNTMNVVFLVQRTSVWNSVKTVYEAAVNRKNVKVYIVTLPQCKNGLIHKNDHSAYEFCKNSFECDVIDSYLEEPDTYYDLSKLSPDYIFLNTPYSYEIPEEYSFEKMSRLAKICYVPYGYTLIKSPIQGTTLNDMLLFYASFIFAESPITYKYCHRRLLLSDLVNHKRLYDIGFPRFDLYNKTKQEHSNQFTILWLPRWTTKTQTDIGNEPSSFFDLKDEICRYAKANPELKIIIRPHPLAFDNYIKDGLMTEGEVAEYKSALFDIPNIMLDETPSYDESLINADVLLSDFSSIVAEYFVTGKPIIYLGSGQNFPREHKDMFNSFYHEQKWSEIEHIINLIRIGADEKKHERKNAIERFMRNKVDNVGEKIIDILINDSEKGRHYNNAK